MKLHDFDFDLPSALIAQYPLKERRDSRLLVFDAARNAMRHRHFRDLEQELRPGDLLIMNNSKVIPARIYGKKLSGGKLECLVERVLDEHRFLAHLKSSKAPKPGAELVFADNYAVQVLGREADLFICYSETPVMDMLHAAGHMPLPPYIQRSDEHSDNERYQTVYAQPEGSVAAPTAGLHFDQKMLESLQAKGIERAYTTLHVGAGTFQPVRAESIAEHVMHKEWYSVSDETCAAINAAKREGRRVIAVGTTAMRSLESAARHGPLEARAEETNIFITPGYSFKVFDGLITNFHLPQSTLLMLVSAFVGFEQMRHIYQEAVTESYRFFSYGDASLLWRKHA